MNSPQTLSRSIRQILPVYVLPSYDAGCAQMRWSTVVPLVIVSSVQFFMAASLFAHPDEKIRIGETAPNWTELKGTDDRTHSLQDYADKAVVVICFTCNSCPYAVDYEDRMIAFSRKYADTQHGVVLVAINANNKPKETLELMKQRSVEKNFPFAYLHDDTQQVADAYGAVYTPEFFVLNKNREVIYIGAMDDKTDASQASVNYVELAVEAALKGQRPQVTENPARGCAIPFRRSRR